MSKLNLDYKKIVEEIALQGYNYVEAEMKSIHRNKKKKLDEVIILLALLYVNSGVDGLITLNFQQQRKLVKDIDKKLINLGKELGKNEVEKVTSILKHNYIKSYYYNAFIINSGLKKKFEFDKLDKKTIKEEVNTPIENKLFADRIMANKVKTINKLKISILGVIEGKVYMDSVAKDINKIFNSDAYGSKKLIDSENTRIQSQAITNLGISMGIENQQYSAILDNRTSAMCEACDGNIYSIFDVNKPKIPQHSNCRCMWINCIDDWSSPLDILLNDDNLYEEWLRDNNINIED